MGGKYFVFLLDFSAGLIIKLTQEKVTGEKTNLSISVQGSL